MYVATLPLGDSSAGHFESCDCRATSKKRIIRVAAALKTTLSLLPSVRGPLRSVRIIDEVLVEEPAQNEGNVANRGESSAKS